MADHGLLKIPAVVLPIDQRASARCEHILEKLYGGDFVLVDVIGIEIDFSLQWNRPGQEFLSTLRSLPSFGEKLTGREYESSHRAPAIYPLGRQRFPVRRPFLTTSATSRA